ncbi:MAG: hypothetical protein D4R73_03705 [Deltaproteobacteria bacterium]|nr:MAG: hypothetical protein D4R73_03705 [Deltaproteobacteria bacterium]
MTPDPYYNPDYDLYLGIDKGFRYPNVTLCIQPDLKWERVIVFFAHYQVLRTTDKNAKIALAIHTAQGCGQLTGGWGLLADASDSKTQIGENLAAFEENESVALEKFAKVNPSSNVAVAYLNAARDARKEIKRLHQEAGLMIKVAEELKISGILMDIPVVRQAIYGVLKLINETSEKNDEA